MRNFISKHKDCLNKQVVDLYDGEGSSVQIGPLCQSIGLTEELDLNDINCLKNALTGLNI